MTSSNERTNLLDRGSNTNNNNVRRSAMRTSPLVSPNNSMKEKSSHGGAAPPERHAASLISRMSFPEAAVTVLSPKENGTSLLSDDDAKRVLLSDNVANSSGYDTTTGGAADYNSYEQQQNDHGDPDNSKQRLTRSSIKSKSSSTRSSKKSEGAPPKPPPLGAFGLFALLYSFSCGGGYGFEDAIGTGKALPITMFCLLVPWIWCLPTALAVSELSTMLPSNAGYLLWCDISMPKQYTMFLAMSAGIGTVVGNAAYPSLFAEYIDPYFFSDEEAVRSGSINLSSIPAKAAICVVCCALNIIGVDVVGSAALILSAVVTLPFLMMFVIQAMGPLWMSDVTAEAIGMGIAVAAAALNVSDNSSNVTDNGSFPFDNVTNATNATAELWLQPGIDWKTIGFANHWDLNWATFLSIGSWNYAGYEAAGQVCEEVADPQKTLLRAFIPLMFSTYVAYLLPIWGGVSVFKAGPQQDWSKWTAGYWPTVGGYIAQGKWLEQYTRAGALASGIGFTISGIATGARLLAGIGQIGALPKRASEFLSAYHPRFKTPVNAILILSVITLLCSVTLSFEKIIGVSQALYMLNMLTIYWAVVYMRKHHPQLARPFKIPLSDRSVVALMVPAVIFSVAVMVSAIFADTTTMIIAASYTVVASILAWLAVRFHVFSGVQHRKEKLVESEDGDRASSATPFLPRASFTGNTGDDDGEAGDGDDSDDGDDHQDVSAAGGERDGDDERGAGQPPLRASEAGTTSTTSTERARKGYSSVTGDD